MPTVDFVTFQSINMGIAAGICIFVILYAIGKLWLTWPQLDERLEKVYTQYGQTQLPYFTENLNNKLWEKKKKKQNKKNLKQKIMDYIGQNPFLNTEKMKINFEQAGWEGKDIQAIFLGAKMFCFLLGLGVGYLVIISRSSFSEASFTAKWLILSLIAFVGWFVPDLYLNGVIKKRVNRIETQFPDALDLIIICLQAGLGLTRAIERVAREIALFSKEIAYELNVTNIELELMLDRRQALQNLYNRVPSTIIRTFTTTVLQSFQQGTPTLQALDILSKDIRHIRMQKAEAKAAKLPSLMVIPLVLFILPNLFIVLLGPAVVRLLNVT
jgi:tight adherence protein C